MDLAGRAVLLGLVLACVGVLGACGSGNGQQTVAKSFSYDRRVPLRPRVAAKSSNGAVHVEQLTYSSSDGTRVPALLATPIAGSSRGCLMYQGGIGQKKESAASIWQGAAALGLSTFTIDPRETGARGSVARLREVIKSPQAMAAVLGDTVIDLRRGLDYLDRRLECKHNIGYLGTSFGAALGAMLAGEDARIKAVVLTSIGATWKQALLASNAAAETDHSTPLVLLPGIDKRPASLAAAVRVLRPFDPATWIAKISPRPVMLINGNEDPVVPPIDALELADAAQQPKSIFYFNGGHDPFAPGPDQRAVVTRLARFLCGYLGSCPTAF